MSASKENEKIEEEKKTERKLFNFMTFSVELFYFIFLYFYAYYI